MTTNQILVAARALIEKPEAWGKGHKSNSPKVGRCVLGALGGVNNPHGTHFNDARKALEEAVGTLWLFEWNDAPERTHAEVLAAFDRAIEATKEQP